MSFEELIEYLEKLEKSYKFLIDGLGDDVYEHEDFDEEIHDYLEEGLVIKVKAAKEAMDANIKSFKYDW